MKNYEKYSKEIKNYNGENFCRDFIRPIILKIKHDASSCKNMDCGHCGMLQNIWLLEEYEETKEPKVDWSKVEVDTPILVSNNGRIWFRRHFAKYVNSKVYAWENGGTSWSNDAGKSYWKYAKLAKDQKEPEVDWNKIEVDTPILVRNNKNNKWLKRYFAKYEDNKVYTWLGETTSYDAYGVTKWEYAKLTESEEE